VVSESIRANTSLRLALRVQDRHDSQDVLGLDDAAHLPRDVPGRAVVRFGPGEAIAMQTAFASGPPATGGSIVVRPLPAAGWFPTSRWDDAADDRPAGEPVDGSGTPSELARLVDAADRADRRLGLPPPRCPWPPALPECLDLVELLTHPTAADRAPVDAPPVPLYLVDDPDHQVQYRDGWHPAAGNLLVAGAIGSGTTTALATVALSLAAQRPPDELHLYVVDAAAGGLHPLAELPHCAGVVGLGDEERLTRLIGRLRGELDRRRSAGAPSTGRSRPGLGAGASGGPDVVLLIDGWPALEAELDRPGGLALAAALSRVVVDGPGVGVRCVIAADRPGALRPSLGAAMTQRLVLRLADAMEQRALGLPAAGLSLPGRGVVLPSGLTVQVAQPGGGGDLRAAVAAAAGRWSPGSGRWRRATGCSGSPCRSPGPGR
jgi:S-DNA-T family DNA segregation ATPase FtsK/SpoIIIE